MIPAALLALGAAVSIAALGFLHGTVQPLQAGLSGGVALGAALVIRRLWDGLPRFVARWLDAGVVVVTALVACALTAVSYGVPYLVLRAPELAAMSTTAGLVGTALAALAYTHRRLAREVAAQEARLAQLRERALESRLSALSAQINPHFLFNTLNTLAEVVHEDEDAAEDLITDLAGMMRHALAGSSRRVPLSEELDIVRRLLRIEQARLGDRLRWAVDLDPVVAEVGVPGLLVQPLVENAVQHAVATRPEGGTVTVRAWAAPDGTRVSVSDDGPGLPRTVADSLEGTERPARGSGEAGGGLWNVAERARLAWTAGRLVHEPSSHGTTLTLVIPPVADGDGPRSAAPSAHRPPSTGHPPPEPR